MYCREVVSIKRIPEGSEKTIDMEGVGQQGHFW